VIEIPAKAGRPYKVDRTGSGLIRLRRGHGAKTITLLLDDAAALGVADALVDTVEQRRSQ